MAASKNRRARLFHIRDEIEAVAIAVEGLSYEQYEASYIHRRAIERAVQIISEAAKALPRDYLAQYADAPWTSIVGIGNVLRHLVGKRFCRSRDWLNPVSTKPGATHSRRTHRKSLSHSIIPRCRFSSFGQSTV